MTVTALFIRTPRNLLITRCLFHVTNNFSFSAHLFISPTSQPLVTPILLSVFLSLISLDGKKVTLLVLVVIA